ncbi:MAG: hypothetical protein ACYDBB_14870 [Armatimonadota bacterium]
MNGFYVTDVFVGNQPTPPPPGEIDNAYLVYHWDISHNLLNMDLIGGSTKYYVTFNLYIDDILISQSMGYWYVTDPIAMDDTKIYRRDVPRCFMPGEHVLRLEVGYRLYDDQWQVYDEKPICDFREWYFKIDLTKGPWAYRNQNPYSEPVNLATGVETHIASPDMAVRNPRGPSVEFVRSYSTALAKYGLSSPGFPKGWFHNYDQLIASDAITTFNSPGNPNALPWPRLMICGLGEDGCIYTATPLFDQNNKPTGKFTVNPPARWTITGKPNPNAPNYQPQADPILNSGLLWKENQSKVWSKITVTLPDNKKIEFTPQRVRKPSSNIIYASAGTIDADFPNATYSQINTGTHVYAQVTCVTLDYYNGLYVPTKIIDPNGHSISLTWGESRRLQSIGDMTLTYNDGFGGDWLLRRVQSGANHTDYTYDYYTDPTPGVDPSDDLPSDKNFKVLSSVSSTTRGTLRYEYKKLFKYTPVTNTDDYFPMLTDIYLPNLSGIGPEAHLKLSYSTTLDSDGFSRVESMTDPLDKFTKFEYSPGYTTVKIYDHENGTLVTSFKQYFDENLHNTGMTDAAGRSTFIRYSTLRYGNTYLPEYIVNKEGKTTTITYDAHGNVASVKQGQTTPITTRP